jgi:uncharacterized Zn finger protein
MEYVSCNLCNSDDYIIINSHYNDRFCNPEIEVRTVICKNCGLVFFKPSN